MQIFLLLLKVLSVLVMREGAGEQTDDGSNSRKYVNVHVRILFRREAIPAYYFVRVSVCSLKA